MDLSEEKIADVKAKLEDYKNTGNPALLDTLREYIFEYMDYDGDNEVIKDLKEFFHM